MTDWLDEDCEPPRWVEALTDEQRYERYLRAKEVVEMLIRMGDIVEAELLKQAIKGYEERHGIE